MVENRKNVLWKRQLAQKDKNVNNCITGVENNPRTIIMSLSAISQALRQIKHSETGNDLH